MLLYQYLLVGVKQLGLNESESLARDWLHSELSGGDSFFDDAPQRGTLRLGWGRRDWRSWRGNLDALEKLASAAGPKYDSAALATATRVLDGVRVRPCERPAEVYEGRGVRVVLRSRGGAEVTRPVDFDTYWQAVFLSLLQPGSEFQRPMCQRCGKALRPSKKLGKPSRAKLCPSCHVAVHRKENQEAARKRWNNDKQRQRQKAAGGKRKG
jgi:hypothetical protein